MIDNTCTLAAEFADLIATRIDLEEENREAEGGVKAVQTTQETETKMKEQTSITDTSNVSASPCLQTVLSGNSM